MPAVNYAYFVKRPDRFFPCLLLQDRDNHSCGKVLRGLEEEQENKEVHNSEKSSIEYF